MKSDGCGRLVAHYSSVASSHRNIAKLACANLGYIHIDEALKLATARTCEEITSLLDKGESAKANASPKKAA